MPRAQSPNLKCNRQTSFIDILKTTAANLSNICVLATRRSLWRRSQLAATDASVAWPRSHLVERQKRKRDLLPIAVCELTLHLSVQQMLLPRAIYSAYFLQCAYKSFYTGYLLKESGLSTLLKSAPQVPFLGTETNLVAKQVHRRYKYRTSARLPQIQLHNRD